MKFKKRYFIPLLFVGGVALGPTPGYEPLVPEKVSLEVSISKLDDFVRQQEAQQSLLKPDNQARIIWADSVRQTDFSIVYLHGFSASPMEGAPLHIELAQRYGANLYLPRMAGHGLDSPDSFASLTPNQLLASAEEALAVGKILGKKVVLMSCSTGGTLGIYLAAHHPEDIHAHLLYSPNIDLENASSMLLTMPWGKQILHQVQGEYRHLNSLKNTPAEQYWTTSYRSVGLIALKSLLEETMTDEIFSRVKHPFLLAYYYKNETEKDKIVSVDRMLDFFEKAQTPASEKWNRPMATVGAHVMISPLQSKDVDAVRTETYAFVEQVLGWQASTQ